MMRHDDAQVPPRLPQVPEGERVYAIGDVHGRDDLLGLLHGAISHDLRQTRPAPVRTRAVYLGDYVDRGPGTADVLERLIRQPLPDCCSVHLRGNHEDLMLDFLDCGATPLWLHNGGWATLASYGVADEARQTDIDTLQRLRLRLRAAMPASHLQFLRGLADCCCCGDYFFVHAGVRPDRPLADQDQRDLIWIRGPFLSSRADFGKRIVHGHTISAEPQVLANRIWHRHRRLFLRPADLPCSGRHLDTLPAHLRTAHAGSGARGLCGKATTPGQGAPELRLRRPLRSTGILR